MLCVLHYLKLLLRQLSAVLHLKLAARFAILVQHDVRIWPRHFLRCLVVILHRITIGDNAATVQQVVHLRFTGIHLVLW